MGDTKHIRMDIHGYGLGFVIVYLMYSNDMDTLGCHSYLK